MKTGDDIACDNARAKATWRIALHPAVEDQLQLVGSAYVEVFADDLLEEDAACHGLIEHLGQGELGLKNRNIVAITGLTVFGRKRMGQTAEPFAQEAVDLLGRQPVADRLGLLRVGAGQDAVVERLEVDALSSQLPLEILVAVDAEPSRVREIGNEPGRRRPFAGPL